MDRRGFLGAAATLAGPVLAGCAGGDGGSSGDGGGGDDGVAETTTAMTTTAEDAGVRSTYPNYDWGKLEDAEPTETTTVTMRNTLFHPLLAAVTAGTEVTFTNEDVGLHTVTIPALDVDEQVRSESSTSVAFDEPGTFDYVCTFHPPGMLGRIVVG